MCPDSLKMCKCAIFVRKIFGHHQARPPETLPLCFSAWARWWSTKMHNLNFSWMDRIFVTPLTNQKLGWEEKSCAAFCCTGDTGAGSGAGGLMHWCIGTLVFWWCCCRWVGALVILVLMHWCTGALVHWYTGVLVMLVQVADQIVLQGLHLGSTDLISQIRLARCSFQFSTMCFTFQTLTEAQRTQKLTPWLGLNLATTWHHLR